MSRRYPKPRKFIPKNKKKYLGDWDNICARSSWEYKCFKWMDDNPNVLEWHSEECVIPYKSPVDGKYHRYFPDIFARMKNSDGRVRAYLIEIKPYAQTIEPKVKSKITKQYITEVCTWGINQAKWKAAKQYCMERNWHFLTLTEKDVNF
jgi:hypothetical protein